MNFIYPKIIRKKYILFFSSNLSTIKRYIEIYLEERNLKKKILVLLVGMALLIGILSGCVEENGEEPANTAPTASFTHSVVHNTSTAGGTVTFDSTATDADGDDITYSWDFGDDTTPTEATEADPSHIYAANGTYTVTLTVSDGTDSYTTDPVDIIVGNVAPTATFTHEATNLSVVFTDASTDPNTDDTLTWLWDFGDDTTNTTQSPTHEYAAAATYNVTLTVTDTYGLTDATEITEITVTE